MQKVDWKNFIFDRWWNKNVLLIVAKPSASLCVFLLWLNYLLLDWLESRMSQRHYVFAEILGHY